MKEDYKMNLQRFAEGGGDGGAAAAGEGGPAAAPAATAQESKPAFSAAEERQMRRTGAIKKGAPAPTVPNLNNPAASAPAEDAKKGTAEAKPAGEDPGEKKPDKPKRSKEERQKEFLGLMNGDYAEEFKQFASELFERVQAKNTKEGQRYAPLLKALSEKYGVDASDLDGLTEAVKGPVKDDAYYQALAMERGTSVENAKAWDRDQTEMRKLKAENEKLSKVAERQRQAAAIQKIQEGWNRQAEAMKAKYPNFDFARERQNPEFSKLMRAGVSLETAYQAVHFQELAQQQVATAARQVEQGVMDRVSQRAARPAENGISPARAGSVSKKDPAAMTVKEREELERQALRGQHITFT